MRREDWSDCGPTSEPTLLRQYRVTWGPLHVARVQEERERGRIAYVLPPRSTVDDAVIRVTPAVGVAALILVLVWVAAWWAEHA